jgi:hypothetical protein
VIRPYSRPVSPPDDGQVRGLVAVDIAGFTRPDRDGDIQFYLHRSLYDYVKGALEAVGIPWEACYHEDRGDGVLLVLPEDVSLPAIADRLAERLSSLVQRHNRVVREAAAMQLRVAIHAGPVSYDGYGIVSIDVNFLFRMLEARALKRLLASSGAGLALIASETVHRDLVTGVPDMAGGDPFRPVRFQVRRTKARAWICLPGQAR